MARLSDLVRVIAEVEGLDRATVALMARSARENGFIKTGGRGLSAAQMGFGDAANLLIAVNATMSISDVPQTIRHFHLLKGRFGREQHSAVMSQEQKQWTNLKKGTFSDALQALLKIASKHSVATSFLGIPLPSSSFLDPSITSASLIIEFTKHWPSAAIHIVERKKWATGSTLTIAFHAPPIPEFLQIYGAGDRTRYDRRETTQIGKKTICAVAEVLAS